MAVRKLKLISKDLIVELVQRASDNNTTPATYTNIARGYHGSNNDIKPSLDHWVKLGVLSSEKINKQTTHWQVENYVLDNMEQLVLNAQHEHKTQLDNSLDKLSGKKIVTKNSKIAAKSESDYWKMIFAFQNVSEFYIKLLLRKEKETYQDNLKFLDIMIMTTLKMIKQTRKKLLANRPPHEVAYLEKALDSIPVFDTQFP
jgi:hypothetical protein